MRIHIPKRPSPALVISLVSLFVALTGVGVAATGGNFILGQVNSAADRTTLAAPVEGKAALQVSNTNTATGSTPLQLNTGAGRPPMVVNSGVKVDKLNADRLDNFDSTAFLQSFDDLRSKACSAGSKTGQVLIAAPEPRPGILFAAPRLYCVLRDRYEPNDSADAAAPLVFSEFDPAEADATIVPATDIDWYTATGSAYAIQVNAVPWLDQTTPTPWTTPLMDVYKDGVLVASAVTDFSNADTDSHTWTVRVYGSQLTAYYLVLCGAC